MTDLSTVRQAEGLRVHFHFHPYNFDSGGHAVEKADSSGVKRKYLGGVTSGPRWDSHGERMTQKAIDFFMEQANRGDVLLYPDLHGIAASGDIGILVAGDILENGDWHTEFRLYDEHDPVDQRAREIASKEWRQVKGLPPYRYPRQKGFSVEGDCPPESIILVSREGQRVMDKVFLDGVILTPRPAYTDSVANAVYKALGEELPLEGTIHSKIRNRLEEGEIKDSYFRRRYQVQDALEEMIREVMNSGEGDKGELLGVLFDEFKSLMVPLVLGAAPIFEGEEPGPGVARALNARNGSADASHVMSAIYKSMDELLLLFKGVEHVAS